MVAGQVSEQDAQVALQDGRLRIPGKVCRRHGDTMHLQLPRRTVRPTAGLAGANSNRTFGIASKTARNSAAIGPRKVESIFLKHSRPPLAPACAMNAATVAAALAGGAFRVSVV